MKKMLFILAVLAAVVAQAASFKWTAANIYGPDGAKFNGSATLYVYTTDVNAATVATTADVVAGVVKDGSTTGKTFSGDYTAGMSYSFFFTVEAAGKTFTSDPKSVAAASVGAPTIGFGSMATATQDPSNWGGGDAPEPTSGLLLLIGGAMLALRRKQK